MSLAPPLITQEEVIEQIKGLTAQKDQLNTHLRQIEEKLRMIEASLSENDHLKTRVQELLDQSLGFFQEEWKRKSDYFPDIRAQSLLKIVDLVNPPKKAASSAAPAAAVPAKKT